MHTGYLTASVASLALAVMCFLTPNVMMRLGRILDRSVGAVEETLLQRRSGRYLLGLCLFGLSMLMFRLGLVAAH
ncbi:MAG: hypothetical protein HYZ92_02935 [Candidatus Omnitrophica bacterium]|nr:hypothetical protein [Candidatus Omnitrophota bacterium]